jgi:hypothetical protein
VFVPDESYQPTLMFVGKFRSQPESGGPEKCFTCKHYNGLERLARDKRSLGILGTFIIYTVKNYIGSRTPNPENCSMSNLRIFRRNYNQIITSYANIGEKIVENLSCFNFRQYQHKLEKIWL